MRTTLVLLAFFSAVILCACTAVLADPIPKGRKLTVEPLAHFRFNGNAKNDVKGEADFELKNTEYQDNALYLNGIYENDKRMGGYRAVCKTPKLDYKKFTVALRIKAEQIEWYQNNLFTGGTDYRWFGLTRSTQGKLAVSLNNGEFRKYVEGTNVEQGKWAVVACSVNIPERKVIVAVNGKKFEAIDLAKDFELTVASSEKKETDKVWSFTNYSNATVFLGQVDELLIYGQALSAEELEIIPLKP